MKYLKIIGILVGLIFCLGIIADPHAATAAQSKIIKKTVKKVVLPPIAPTTTPSTLEVTPTISTSPPPLTTEVQPLSKSASLFGLGINADVALSYLFNRSGQSGAFLGRGDITFDDPLKLGAKIGLAEDAIEYKLGLGALIGNDINGNSIKSIPLFADAVLYLREGSLFGQDPFLGAGLNYNLLGSGSQIGGLGGQYYGGCLVNLGLPFGKTAIIIGYNVNRVNTLRSAEGVTLSVMQPLTL